MPLPIRLFPCLVLSLVFGSAAPAMAQSTVVKTDEVRAELVAQAPEGVAPGKPLWLGLAIRHKPHWHTYWKNAGDSGLPTSLAWTLPAGVTAGEIQWPMPKRLPVGPLMDYGYEDELLLPVPVSVSPEFRAAALDVRLRADWLVCKDVCIPQSGEFRLQIPAQASTVSQAALFDAAQAATPRVLPGVSASARVDGAALAIDVAGLPADWRGQPLSFFAANGGVIDHAARLGQQWQDGRLALHVPLSPQRSESPAEMQAVLAAAGRPAGVELRFSVAGGWPAANPAAAVVPPEAEAGATAAAGAAEPPSPAAAAPAVSPLSWAELAGAAVMAFVGGLALNLMPCVFPILSLKVLSFAKHAHERRYLAASGLAYTAGVVVTFVALAALLLALRGGGQELGWGFQLQSPPFVAALALLFTLIGLNFAGVFDFGNVKTGRLAGARARHPVADHALTGVLAVMVASPCTAPFMGVALGVALTQPAPVVMAVFIALGLGMAAPYLAATLWPGFGRLLPRPGAWMVRFKSLMAFPMFVTVVWLVWVLGQQVGNDGVAALLGVLVALAFAAWSLGGRGFGRISRRVYGVLGLLVLALSFAWASPTLREAPPAGASAGDAGHPGSRWQPWSPQAVADARSAGRPVFIDFTAAWCITCQVNKRATLSNKDVLADFEARKVLLLRADWTRRDATITEELARLGRSGVPVYVVYGPDRAKAPQVLSELLSVADVRQALARW